MQSAGRHAQALERLAELEHSLRRLQDWRRLGQTLNVRGNALSELRRWPDAVATFRESARLAWDHFALYELAFVVWNLPRALAHVREPEQALRLAGFATTLWLRHFGALTQADHHDLRRLRRLAACQLPAARIDALLSEGAALTLPEALAIALR